MESLNCSHSVVLGLKDKETHHEALQEVRIQQTSPLAGGHVPDVQLAGLSYAL